MDTQLTWCWRPKSSLVYIQFAVVKICDAAVPSLVIGFKMHSSQVHGEEGMK